MNKNRETIVALILTICAPIIWSTGGIGVRLLNEGPWTILFWRSVFMTLTFVVWAFISNKKQLMSSIVSTLKEGKWVSLFIAMSFSFYVFSITRTTVADSLLIQGTAPIFIVIFGWIILREPVKRISIAALFGVLAGIAVIILPSLERGGFTGNVFGIGKALAFASGAIVIRNRKKINLIPSVAVAALITIVISAPFVENYTISPRSLLVFVYLGVVQSGIGYILFATWSRKLPASETGLIVILEAILGPLWVWAFLAETPHLFTFFGGAVIIATLVIHTLVFYKKD